MFSIACFEFLGHFAVFVLALILTHLASMFQGQRWVALMADYSKSHEEGEAVQSELSSLCSQLNRLVEKKAALFWHIDNFEKYIREDINPYGLRIQIFPLVDHISPEFKKR